MSSGIIALAPTPRGQAPVTGINFIPPLNAKPQIVAPPLPRATLNSMLARAGASLANVPKEFAWYNPQKKDPYEDMKRRLGHAFFRKHDGAAPMNMIMLPPDQYLCGSCWAISSANISSDRYSIQTGEPNPNLSCNELVVADQCGKQLSNWKGSGGCNAGGFPADAGNWIRERGLPSVRDWPYFCTADASRGGDGMCRGPNCSVGQNKAWKRWHGAGRVHTLAPPLGDKSGRAEMQMEILLNGPAVATYIVYSDFQSYRGGIYINHSNVVKGAHAVAVVGWGEEQGVKYWLVRNSWGKAWAHSGFFKIAMSSPGVNERVGFDHNYRGMGGFTFWQMTSHGSAPPVGDMTVDVSNIDNQTGHISGDPTPHPKPNPNPKPRPNPDHGKGCNCPDCKCPKCKCAECKCAKCPSCPDNDKTDPWGGLFGDDSGNAVDSLATDKQKPFIISGGIIGGIGLIMIIAAVVLVTNTKSRGVIGGLD